MINIRFKRLKIRFLLPGEFSVNSHKFQNNCSAFFCLWYWLSRSETFTVQFSGNINGPALRYDVGVSISGIRILAISGTFRPDDMPEVSVFHLTIKSHLSPERWVITYLGYADENFIRPLIHFLHASRDSIEECVRYTKMWTDTTKKCNALT